MFDSSNISVGSFRENMGLVPHDTGNMFREWKVLTTDSMSAISAQGYFPQVFHIQGNEYRFQHSDLIWIAVVDNLDVAKRTVINYYLMQVTGIV